MKLSSELDKIIRQNVKDDSAYQVIRHMIVQEPTEAESQSNYLQQLHKIATAHYDNLDEMFDAYLKMGCLTLDMSQGNINRIEDDVYYIEAQFPQQLNTSGAKSLHQTLCHYVTIKDETLAYHHINAMNPPLAESIISKNIESYIGTAIYVDDTLWGTICFYGDDFRDPFTTAEIEFVELMAVGISNVLNTRMSRRQQQQAQQRYRLIFENIDIPVLIYDVETYEIFDVNPSATEFYGYRRDELLELTMLDINMMPQSDIEMHIADSREAGLPYTRFPHRLKLGDIRDVEEYSNEIMIENRRLRFSLIYDFSERHAAEEALKHSEANLRAIFDNASQLMFLVDETATIIAMNRAASRMIQLIDGNRMMTTDTTIHKYHPKSDRYLNIEYINLALQGHSTTHDTHITVDDQLMYITYRYVPVKTADDQVIGVCVTGQDVTSLKLSEEKLAYERNILRTLIDNLPDAIYIKDENARLLTANKRYLEIASVDSTEEILGKTDLDLHEEFGRQYYEDDQYVLDNGTLLNKDEPVILPDDSEGIFATTKIPLKDDEGNTFGLVGVGHDITKQREIEQGLRDNEEKFHQLITHIPEAFWIYDIAEQTLIYASENYEMMFGVSPEARQRDVNAFMEQVHPDDHDKVLEAFRRQSQGKETAYEARFVNDKQAGIRWVNVRIYPVLNEDGDVYRVAGVASDVTEEKRAQETMLEMMAQEERINILSTFFRDASHEFRTPLSVINTSLYVMDKTDDADKRQIHVDLIREQVRGISELVEMLVLMSRLDSGAEVTLSVTNVNAILNQFKQTVEDIYPERASDFRISLHTSLPPIIGNRTYIMQAVRNLIDNAVRYSDKGSPVVVRSYHDENHVIIDVTDRGIGIPDEERNKIFRRFYRSDEAHSTRGFGLGLPIAQSIAHRHGGDITLESSVGKGSRFSLLLPTLKVLRD